MSNADILTLKIHGSWHSSSVVESYVTTKINKKINYSNTAKKIHLEVEPEKTAKHQFPMALINRNVSNIHAIYIIFFYILLLYWLVTLLHREDINNAQIDGKKEKYKYLALNPSFAYGIGKAIFASTNVGM